MIQGTSRPSANIVVELSDLLGRAVAEEQGMVYSHAALPSPTYTSIGPTTDARGRLCIVVPSVKATMHSICYSPKGGKPVSIEWPPEYNAVLLAAQRWGRGDGPLPRLPEKAAELLPVVGSRQLASVFAAQAQPSAHVTPVVTPVPVTKVRR